MATRQHMEDNKECNRNLWRQIREEGRQRLYSPADAPTATIRLSCPAVFTSSEPEKMPGEEQCAATITTDSPSCRQPTPV